MTTPPAHDACYRLFASWQGDVPTGAAKIAAACPTVADIATAILPYAPSQIEAAAGAEDAAMMVCSIVPSAPLCEASK